MTTELIFNRVLPSNNGPGGLLRMHWTKKLKWKEWFYYTIRAQTTNRHPGPVRIEIVRHGIKPLDSIDNLSSSVKLCIDQLKAAAVIVDDDDTILAERDVSQTKAINMKSQFTSVRIIDL